jgi:hypothetical protein
MALSASDFTGIYPEFADATKYAPSAITFFLNQAYGKLNALRWAGLLDEGAADYTAHKLVLAIRNAQASARGGVPGAIVAPLASKGVGPVSASYDVGAVTDSGVGASYWNQTSYGLNYWRNVQLVGMGALFAGGGVVYTP